MMDDPTILFFGYGSEYSLNPLYKFMSGKGDRCVEIDMLTHNDCVGHLKRLVGQPLIFLTSAHPLFDLKNFFYYRTDREIISALHVISTLRPELSIYYPHDYKDPVKPEEVHYLTQFDLLMWPHKQVPAAYERLVKSVPVGWIKNPAGHQIDYRSSSEAVFFPGAYQYYLRAGFNVFYDDYHDLFNAGIAVKFPLWHENKGFEDFLREREVRVYPSSANSVEIIKSCDAVIAHALSSVGMEACHLGKKVVYILDPRFDYKDPLAEYAGVGNICYVNSPSAVSRSRAAGLSANEYSMGEFNFDFVRDLILREYRENGKK